MAPTAKTIRKVIKDICGAWVRVWPDGKIWCGIGEAGAIGRRQHLAALVAALESAGYGCTFEGKPGTSGAHIVTVTVPEAS